MGIHVCNQETHLVCPGWRTNNILQSLCSHQAINEFSTCDVEDKKELLLQNLDPMFNIKSAFFFLR